MCGDAGDPLCQFLGVHSAIVVHEVVGSGLSEVVLGLVVHYLVVNFSLGALELLVTDPGCKI